jgi:hypothetical protein
MIESLYPGIDLTVMTGSITFVDARVNQEGSCEKMRDDKPAASIHGKNWVADGKAGQHEVIRTRPH